MASNRIPTSYDSLVSLAEDAADGAATHGATGNPTETGPVVVP